MLVHLPHQTPTIEIPFTSVRLSDIFGISPFAKPITRSLPLNAVALNACSVTSPQTGSMTISTPLPFVKSLTVSFKSVLSYLTTSSAPKLFT